MPVNRIIRGLAVISSVLALGAGPCNKVTGGGMVDGVAGRATIAFNGNGCGDVPRGQLEYVDHDSGVKMHAELIEATFCFPEDQCTGCLTGEYQLIGDYRSTNPSFPGTGQLRACVADLGEGKKATANDTASIQIFTGPYAGYFNSGIIHGNVQQHKCPGKGGSF